MLSGVMRSCYFTQVRHSEAEFQSCLLSCLLSSVLVCIPMGSQSAMIFALPSYGDCRNVVSLARVCGKVEQGNATLETFLPPVKGFGKAVSFVCLKQKIIIKIEIMINGGIIKLYVRGGGVEIGCVKE